MTPVPTMSSSENHWLLVSPSSDMTLPAVLRAGFPQCTYTFRTSLLSIFMGEVLAPSEQCLCSHGAYCSTTMVKQ